MTLSKLVREKWAVLIGIGEFKDSGATGLRFPAKDAQDLKSTLVKNGHFKDANIRLVLNKDATVQGIREAIGWLRERVKPEDLVFVYVSSHGSPKQMDSLGVSYVIAHDTVLEPPSKLYSTSYQMVQLVEDLNRDVPAGRLVLALDTCHSGGAVAQAKSLNVRAGSAASYAAPLEQMQSGVGRAILTASRADERSWESPKLDGGKGNGFFTYFLKEALAQDQGVWNLQKICGYVQSHVPAAVAEAKIPAEQNPTCSFSDGGADIVLGVVPQSNDRISLSIPRAAASRGRNKRL